MINEFLADPDGADAGAEFVELINTGPHAVDLSGVKLQFANGSVGPEWDDRWSGGNSLVLEAGDLFLIVDRNWASTTDFDAQVALGLQNGPDAIRLVRDGTALDMVGYGRLHDPLMMEGEAVPLPTGRSLGRRPDGWDSNDNSLDFHAIDPSPGQKNFLDYALEVVEVLWDPSWVSSAGDELQLDLQLLNTGLLEFPDTILELQFLSSSGASLPVAHIHFSGCLPGAIWAARLVLQAPGEGTFRAQIMAPETSFTPVIVLPLGRVQIGAADLIWNEVMHLPAHGEGEWVELEARRPLTLGDYSFRDEDGTWRPFPDLRLDAGQRALVVQDSLGVWSWAQDLLAKEVPSSCLEDLEFAIWGEAERWPNLNNSPPAGRPFADRLYLADSLGVVIHQVTLPSDGEGGAQKGISWERDGTDDHWRPSLAPPGSTPGCLNSVTGGEWASGALVVQPRLMDSAGESPWFNIHFPVPVESTGWHVEIYNLWGEQVRDLGGQNRNWDEVDLVWDGCGDDGQQVIAGAYIVVLLLAYGEHAPGPVARTLVVVR